MWTPIDRPGQAGPAPALCVVAGESWHGAVAGWQFDFFTLLAGAAARAGVRTCLAEPAPGLAARLADKGHAVILIGPRLPVAPGILHAHPAYVRGFWMLDPQGVHHASSLATVPFDPRTVDRAQWFFDGVAGWMRRQNLSKFDQPPRDPLAPAAAAVFAQEIEGWKTPVHYLTTTQIVTEVGRAGGRALVKPHPAMSPAALGALRAAMAPWPGLVETSASVHDIAAAARVVVTQNSAAGFEALMARTPVITCAASDYARATVVARTPADLAAALTGPLPDRPGVAFFTWFLRDQCLEPAQPDFLPRAWARLRQACPALPAR